jgi:hypothetical protein
MFNQQFKAYVDLDKTGDRYEVDLPPMSAHNLVIGTMYIDVGETMTITNLQRPNEKCTVKFERRGWLSKEAFKLTGEVFAGGSGKQR